MKRFKFLAAMLLLLAAGSPKDAGAKVRVVASINDLASIAASVGGDQVEVLAIARPTTDVHRVEILPSYMVRVSKAQLYLKVGLQLDQWADGIIDGSRNDRLVVLDCSEGIAILDRPLGKVDASLGDVHPSGNPHYWLDPRNGAIVARAIAEALARLDPEHSTDFAARADEFARSAEAAFTGGAEFVRSLPSRNLVTYHASWVYFANAYGLTVAATIEPVPGIPPTGRHLQRLVEIIREREIRVVLQEPYFSAEAAEFLARETGAAVAKVSPSCESPEAGSYLEHFEMLLEALKPGK